YSIYPFEMFIVKSTYVEHPIGKILLAATSIASAVVLIRHYAYRSAIAAVRVRNHVCRNRAIVSSSADDLCCICIHSRLKNCVLICLRSCKLECLIFSLKTGNLILSKEIKNGSCVAIVIFQNISCYILNRISGVASLCCDVIPGIFDSGQIVAAALLVLELDVVQLLHKSCLLITSGQFCTGKSIIDSICQRIGAVANTILDCSDAGLKVV